MNSEQDINEVKDRHASELLQVPNVVGIGVEQDETGQFVITVHLKDDDPDTLSQLPSQIEGYPVKIELSGPYRKL